MRSAVVLGIGALVVAGLVFFILRGQGETEELGFESNTAEELEGQVGRDIGMGKSFTKAEQVIEERKKYVARLSTTEGDVLVELDSVSTPVTVNNFVFLAKNGFYDNTVFHRAINGFMVQGGDPTGTGAGGPGYQFDDEPFEGEYVRGVVAMANAGPNTNGSQFFIMHEDTPLPKQYVIFGKVIEGMETVDKIATADVVASPQGELSKPVSPVSVTGVDIIESDSSASSE